MNIFLTAVVKVQCFWLTPLFRAIPSQILPIIIWADDLKMAYGALVASQGDDDQFRYRFAKPEMLDRKLTHTVKAQPALVIMIIRHVEEPPQCHHLGTIFSRRIH